MDNLPDAALDADATIATLRARIAALEAALAARHTPSAGHIPDDVILDAIQDAVIVLDQERRIRFWNRAAEALYGWRAAEVAGRNLQEVLQSHYPRGGNAAQSLAAIERQGSWTGLVIQRHRDGHELYIESSVRFLHDATGAASGLVGVNRDVTARVREETARHVSDTARALLAATRDDAAMLAELARLAVPTLGDWCAIHLIEDDGSVQPIAIQHTDPARRAAAAPFAEAYGLSPDITFGIAQVLRTGQPELIPDVTPARLDAMVLDPKQRPSVRSLGLRSVMCVPLKTGEAVLGAITFATAESGRRYSPADLQTASDLAERAALAIAHSRMTREVQAAAERSDSTLAMLTTLLTSAAIGVAFLDRALRVTQINATLAALTGLAVESSVGQSALAMLPEYADILQHRLQSLLATGAPLIDIEVTIAPGTSVRPGTYILNYYPVPDAAGQITGIGMVVLDITERKRLQAELSHSQRLEGIGRLAGGIAHDFNNLMTAILGYAELAAEALPAESVVRQDLAEIGTTAQRAAALTRQLLAFARKQVLEPVPLSLNDLVGEVAGLLQRLIGEDIKLTTHLAPDPWTVRADEGQIEQVMINLAVNARDAMPQGGELIIETANITLDAAYARAHVDVAPGDYVRIAVTDTGVGMPPEIQARIFEPFFTTKPAGQGTGLGLATCYGIVQQHGGAIWVYSEPGHGTTFAIYLPQVQEAATSRDAALLDVELPRGSETVLVVEDEEVVRTLAARILREQGYTILEARDGRHALEVAMAYGEVIDLVLTDMVMPGLGGDTLGTQLKARIPFLKTLHMSGYTEHSMIQRGALDPATPLLQKPFTRSTLVRAVRRALDAPHSTST